jgi:RHS repeat-associated protein
LYDPDTGLVRFGARDYDAEVGRWTGKDPMGFKARDTNLLSYAGNDPVNRTDPTGRDWGDACYANCAAWAGWEFGKCLIAFGDICTEYGLPQTVANDLCWRQYEYNEESCYIKCYLFALNSAPPLQWSVVGLVGE